MEVPDECQKMTAKTRQQIAKDIAKFVEGYLGSQNLAKVADDASKVGGQLKIDFGKVNERRLQAMGMSDGEIENLLRLAELWRKVTSLAKLDNDQVAHELKEIMDNLANLAHEEFIKKSHVQEKDPDWRKKQICEKIKDITGRVPQDGKHKMTDRERGLLMEDIKDLIGEIIGPDFVGKMGDNWNLDFASRLDPNLLKMIPLEEKQWIKKLQTLLGVLSKTQTNDEANSNKYITALLDVVQKSIEGSRRGIEVNRGEIAANQANIDAIKELIMKIPTNEEAKKMPEDKKLDLIKEIKKLAKCILHDYLLDDIDVQNLESLDIDGLNLPEPKKEELRLLQKILRDLLGSDSGKKTDFNDMVTKLIHVMEAEEREQASWQKEQEGEHPKDPDPVVDEHVEAYVRFLKSIKEEIPEGNGEQMGATTKEIVSQSWDTLVKFLQVKTKQQRSLKVLPDVNVFMALTTSQPNSARKAANPEDQAKLKEKQLRSKFALRSQDLMSCEATYNLNESSKHLVMANAIKDLLRSKRSLDNLEIHKILDQMIDRAKNLTGEGNSEDDFDILDQYETPPECLPDDKAIFDIQDLIMRLPLNGKKITEQEKSDLIAEIKNVIAILHAYDERDEQIGV